MEMMKSSGESSSKGREDGDAATGSERPLKKARFAWQVKGKYHLKNETDEPNKNLTRPSVETPSSEPSPTKPSSTSIIENNVENYLMQQEYSKLDSEGNSDYSYLLTPINNLSTEQYQYPRYMSSFERSPDSMPRANRNNDVKFMAMADTEDQCIARWQVKQIVNGCLDNTLNRVLESWTTDTPQANAVESRFMARDFAEFINHLPGDNSVENEGILMAISAHGLQNTSSSSNDNSVTENCSISSTPAFDILSPLRSLSPLVSDDDSQLNKLQQHETENKLPSETKLPDWQSDSQNASDSNSFAYFSEPPQSPYHFYNDNIQNSNTDSLDIDGHFDFMNAAVMYAIKSKGLTASGTEYG